MYIYIQIIKSSSKLQLIRRTRQLQSLKMAKFAIALCILLVACGAQGSNSSTLMGEIRDEVEYFAQKVEDYQEGVLKSILIDLLYIFELYTEHLNNIAQDYIAGWERSAEEWEVDAEQLNLCISLCGNFTQKAHKVASNITSCAKNAEIDFESNYNKIITEVKEYKTMLNKTLADANSCLDYSGTVDEDCITKIHEKAISDLSNEWITLEEKIMTFLQYYYSFMDSYGSCDFNCAFETLSIDLNNYSHFECNGFRSWAPLETLGSEC